MKIVGSCWEVGSAAKIFGLNCVVLCHGIFTQRALGYELERKTYHSVNPGGCVDFH